jgi:hypothetical protein
VLKLLEFVHFQETSQKLWHIFWYYKRQESAAKTAASTFFESNERQWSKHWTNIPALDHEKSEF